MIEQASVTHFLSDVQLEPRQFLYHYTNADSLGKILTTGNIRLNNLDQMNDPREKKAWQPRHLLMPAGAVTAESMDRDNLVAVEPDRLLRQGARIACFTGERLQYLGADPTSLFHRGWARARMWHQYGDGHMGACLVFDYDNVARSMFAAVPVGLGDVQAIHDVTYVDRPLDLPLTGSFETVGELQEKLNDLTGDGKSLNDLFFTKNTDWQSEDEVRALVLRWRPEEQLPPDPLDLPYGISLRAIVLGEGFDEIEQFDSLLPQSPVSEDDVLRAAWIDGAPRLRPYKER